MRVILLILHAAIATVSGDLDTGCDNLVVDSFYEQGKCYTLHIVGPTVRYSEKYDQCTDIQENVHNVGLVMWLPDTVKTWLNTFPTLKMGLMGMQSSLPAIPGVTNTEWGDSFRFMQGRTLDDGPSWPANVASQSELFQPTFNPTPATFVVTNNTCMFYGNFGFGIFQSWTECEIPDYAALNAFICVYASNVRVWLKMTQVDRRMLAKYSISNGTFDHNVECLAKMFSDCAPCHSFAYNSATGDCQIYIPDSRVVGYNETMLEVAAGYNIWEYK